MFANEQSVQEEIRATYGAELGEMTALHQAVLPMLTDSWTISNGTGLTYSTVMVVLGILVKASKTFRSVQVLCERGLHEDATALARVLFETTIAGGYILVPTSGADVNTRATTYFAYSLYQQRKMQSEWRKTEGLKHWSPAGAVENMDVMLASLKRRLPPGTLYTKHWSGKNDLLQAVKELKGDHLYQVFYRFASSIAHASDMNLHFELTDANPDADRVWHVEPRAEGVEKAAKMARFLLWTLAGRISERLGLPYGDVLRPHGPPAPDVLPA